VTRRLAVTGEKSAPKAARWPGRGQRVAGVDRPVSTGEEAYTLAMVFTEALNQPKSFNQYLPCRSMPPTWTRTPLTRLARASFRRTLPPMCQRQVSPSATLPRFFVKEENGYRVNKQIRAMGGLGAAESDHGSTVHQIGYFVLSETC